MEPQQQAVAAHPEHGKAQFFWVWGALLLMTAIEVFLAYQHLQPAKMLTILMGLSIFKAALIISYFMHMKFEHPRMRVLLMGSLAACLCLMTAFFPDAWRIIGLGIK